jgi:hypothetical protein
MDNGIAPTIWVEGSCLGPIKAKLPQKAVGAV